MADWTAYRVVDAQHDEALAKIAKINKRQRKLGLPEIELEFRGEHEFILDPDGIRVIEYRTIYMRADVPTVADYEIIGIIHPSSAGEGNIVQRIPGAVGDLTDYYNVPFTCDHCGWLRRRNDTFIVRQRQTGERKQVGSTCMKDFLNGTDPHSVMKMAEVLVDLDDFLSKPRKREEYGKIADDPKERTVSLLGFLAMVAKDIRETGRWISSKEAYRDGGQSTAYRAWWSLWDKEEVASIIAEDWAAAQGVIDWGRANLSADSPNEYIHNLAVIVSGDHCSYREAGIVGSIYRAREREQAANAKKKEAKNEFLGRVGERITRTVVVDEVRYLPSHFTKILTKMTDAETEAAVTWFSSGTELEEGGTYRITGTIKQNKDWKGKKETIITRCKVEEWIAVQEQA